MHIVIYTKIISLSPSLQFSQNVSVILFQSLCVFYNNKNNNFLLKLREMFRDFQEELKFSFSNQQTDSTNNYIRQDNNTICKVLYIIKGYRSE